MTNHRDKLSQRPLRRGSLTPDCHRKPPHWRWRPLVWVRPIPVYPIRAYLLERRPASSTTIMTTMLQRRARFSLIQARGTPTRIALFGIDVHRDGPESAQIWLACGRSRSSARSAQRRGPWAPRSSSPLSPPTSKYLTALLKKHGNQMFDAQSISTDAPLLDKAHTRSSSRNAVSG